MKILAIDPGASQTDTEVYVLRFPTTPPSANDPAWRNRMGQYRIRHEWKTMVWALLHEVDGPRPPRNCRRIALHAVITFATERERDRHNYGAALWKGVCDGLVEQHIVPNDSAKHVLTHDPMLTTGDRPGTIVVLRVLEGPEGKEKMRTAMEVS